MVDLQTLPSFVGYPPDEAEGAATELGLVVMRVDADPPRWLPESHEPRVARQRLLPDGRLELLCVLAPLIVP